MKFQKIYNKIIKDWLRKDDAPTLRNEHVRAYKEGLYCYKSEN